MLFESLPAQRTQLASTSLYAQGINGILADEMGPWKDCAVNFLNGLLGRKAQPLGTFFGHHSSQYAAQLAAGNRQIHSCTACSSLLGRGSVTDRATLRKFWNVKLSGQEDAPFHILGTSYQSLVADEKAFQAH